MKLMSFFRRWLSDKRGATAIMFALSAIPALGIMGLGIDFYRGLSYKSRFNAAADSAAIVAITTAQQFIGLNAANLVDVTTPAMAAGKAAALKSFPTNAATAMKAVPATAAVTMSRTGQTLTATITYAGTMQTGFGSLFGIRTYGLSGTSSASLTMPKYMDFYLLLDTSGSMGLPTTPDGQTALSKVNPDNGRNGCVFACHFSGYQGYNCSRGKPGGVSGCNTVIALRADSVGSAVQALLQTATATETMPSQFRIGLFPFIVHAAPADPTDSNNSVNPHAIYSDFTKPSLQAGQLATYLDTGTWVSSTWPWGSGGTHFENMAADMQPYLPTSGGDGSSPLSTQPFIFIVTDGADNSQTYIPPKGFSGSQPQLPPSTFSSWCTTEKSRQVSIAILYTPYLAINASNGGENAENTAVDNIIPQIPTVLSACASPGFFFTANSPQDITNAMQAMFAQATQQARLTH